MRFQGADILSIDQFELADIAEIFSVAAEMEVYARREKVTRVLEGAVLGNLFLEPSTRSRVSFETAFYRLGGAVSNTIGSDCSSIVKGESLYDTSRVMGGYVDVLVVRHPEEGSVKKIAEATTTPVISSGDGAGEHPTQALLDLYTIMKEQGRSWDQLEGLSITMIGDLKHGRTVHSLTKLLSLFKNISFTFVSPEQLKMPPALVDQALMRGHKVTQTEDIASGIAHADVIYMTRIQEERFAHSEEAGQYRGCYSLNRGLYEKVCRPGAVVLHPLPRDSRPGSNEIDNDLNDHPALAIFRQAENGIPLRMALFAMVLDVVPKLGDRRW
ncbi:MAG: aspartate carbamoyltransferase [Chthoniobacterales bacterium]|nr:aspartate carbamoyltransferase [Chthoniobacterales bacterium]